MRTTTIKLTTPEAFDKLIEYLETKRGLYWSCPQYRDSFIKSIKEDIQRDTVLLDIIWEYSLQKQDIICYVMWSKLSEMQTDKEFVENSKECNE